jgi:DNA-binding NarL/FixJ family response regulator
MSAIVAIVDSSRTYRENLAACLDRTRAFHCVGAYADSDRAFAGLAGSCPDILLFGLQSPAPQAFEAMALIRQSTPMTRIVVMIEREDESLILEAFRRGACAYCLKHDTSARLVQTLEEVLRGGSPLSPRVARHMIERLYSPLSPCSGAASPRALVQAQPELSGREQEILEYLARGYPYKQIADRLAISINTVRTYVRRLYAKLEVPCRTHAILKCQPVPWPIMESDACGIR